MWYLFVSENIVNPYTLGIDSTLIKAHGKVWYKSSIKKGIVPCSGIDTDAILININAYSNKIKNV